MSSAREPAESAAVLGEADPAAAETGWDPEGGKPTAEPLAELTQGGYRPVDATRAVLAQVSGIHVTRRARPPKRKARTFHFDVPAALAAWDVAYPEMAGIDADDDLCLIGDLPSERMFLASDTAGTVYAGNGRQLHRLGRSVAEALETLLSHTDSTAWPRVTAPPRPPHPVLARSEDPHPVTGPQEAVMLAVATRGAASGPVLGVADLGDVWRVYRATHALMVRPFPVPLLVSKETGDVRLDWPNRRDAPTAQDGYRELLSLLDPHLRAWGFTGSGRSWRYRGAEEPLSLRFRAHHDATVATLAFEVLLIPGNPLREDECQAWATVKVDTWDVYFHVLAGVDVRPMADAVLAVLSKDLKPRLAATAAAEGSPPPTTD
ncbi:SUKH-3 domain-containing protein [Intrasporangium sp. YIM S08009]|uniref:SUKH-3 domain-containing protein n=1 Tax=Intrasporangium zincisolvens TaxID=3080018 RepID=UPI002B059E76|nr:SUKH-3 domain-containing protein [Intrasporangium sp. YIM S08009]